MEKLKIRTIEQEDLASLLKIGWTTFLEAYKGIIPRHDLLKYLEEHFSKRVIQLELLNPNSRFFFAESENQAIGYLKVNVDEAQTSSILDKSLEIERIYVLREFQNKKVGKSLFNKAISIAKTDGLHYVWLGVWEENHRAIRFYQKNGMVQFDKHDFKLGDQLFTDVLMKVEIG